MIGKLFGGAEQKKGTLQNAQQRNVAQSGARFHRKKRSI